MKLLLLAGTTEARDLATRLAGRADVEVVASFAGATRAQAALPVPVRLGGFGGGGAQKDFIQSNGFDTVIDATHPFAATIPTRTKTICVDLGIPRLRLVRPGWTPGPGEHWHRVPAPEALARLIPEIATVFLATGPRQLRRYRGLSGRRLICRRIDPTDEAFPFPGGRFLVAGPPHTVASEAALFTELEVDWLVAKDSGGPGREKLDAARALGIEVALIDRPAQPPGDTAATVDEALAWLERQR